MRSFIVLLTLLIVVSALGVVWVRHENRALVPQLQALYTIRDDLNIEWRQLLAERAALSRHTQLKNWLDSTDDMTLPSENTVLFVTKDGASQMFLEGLR